MQLVWMELGAAGQHLLFGLPLSKQTQNLFIVCHCFVFIFLFESQLETALTLRGAAEDEEFDFFGGPHTRTHEKLMDE